MNENEPVFPDGKGQGRNPYDPAKYPGAGTCRVMQDGKSTLMLPHQPGDTYSVLRYPGGYQIENGCLSTGYETAQRLRQLPAGSGYEIIHMRDGAEIARYWPMTVIDCAG